ncbi:MAG: chorismate-binding protein [Candidatus Omnitrophica bacterium]|nr:chorismate-binding protein [Candidatus Omnitrophota bacterium]
MKPKITIKTIPADRFTPLVVFKKLAGKALLESAVLEIGKSRYSIILVEEAFRLILDKNGVHCLENGKKRAITRDRKKFLELVEEAGKKVRTQENFSIPIPAAGLGYLGYETAMLFDKINLAKQQDELNLPDSIFMFGSIFAIFDHYKSELHLVAIDQQGSVNAKNKLEGLALRLLDDDFRAYKSNDAHFEYSADIEAGKQQFISGVKTIRDHIIAGNLVQAVLSRRVDVKTHLPAIEAYSRLRRENPSPYLFYLDFDDFQLLGASPELMVSLSGDIATIKPIAGTRRRGKDRAEDVALEKELLADEKERAEHLMLVDLARNDLGRAAASGKVTPVHLYGVERYAHVMHIVSEIEAPLRKDQTACDLIKATFPAGTVSGAPKIMAMQIVSQIEKTKRGPYAGLIGHFDVNGNFESCITIRSYIHKNDHYYIQAGAGIVYDSVPEKEFEETVYKSKALIKALGVKI